MNLTQKRKRKGKRRKNKNKKISFNNMYSYFYYILFNMVIIIYLYKATLKFSSPKWTYYLLSSVHSISILCGRIIRSIMSPISVITSQSSYISGESRFVSTKKDMSICTNYLFYHTQVIPINSIYNITKILKCKYGITGISPWLEKRSVSFV